MGGSATTVNLSYDTTNTAYKVYGSGGDYFGWFAIPNIQGQDNLRISVKVKLASTTAYNQCMIGLTDTQTTSSSSSFTADMLRIRADNKSDYLHNSGNEVSGSSSSTTVQNNWVYIVFERSSSSIVGKVYDDNKTLLRTYNYTTNNSYSNPYYFIGMNCKNTSDIKYIQEILVESL